MLKITMDRFYKSIRTLIALCALIVVAACAPAVTVKEGELHSTDYAAIIVKEGDTFSKLAGRFYGDKAQAWRIAEFNSLKSALAPGSSIIIPLVPGTQPITESSYQTVPVLVYHKFSKTKKNRMTVAEADFDAQMRWLKENGYKSLTLSEFYGFLRHAKKVPVRSVLITLDDGWRSQHEIALPILIKYEINAVLFLTPNTVNGIGGDGSFSWKMVKDMASNGVEIENHGLKHLNLEKPDELRSISPGQYLSLIESEVLNGSDLIQKNTGRIPEYFAYSYGANNQLIVEVLKKHGYKAAFTVRRGSVPFFVDDFRVNRSMVYGSFTLDDFKKNLTVKGMRALK
jgi:peptidoglycan/xylan/chitin deacetylase (PgdA/CDA1 family)